MKMEPRQPVFPLISPPCMRNLNVSKPHFAHLQKGTIISTQVVKRFKIRKLFGMQGVPWMSAIVLTQSRCSVKAECTQKRLHYCLRHSLELRAVGQHQTLFHRQGANIHWVSPTKCWDQVYVTASKTKFWFHFLSECPPELQESPLTF